MTRCRHCHEDIEKIWIHPRGQPISEKFCDTADDNYVKAEPEKEET